MSETLVNSRFRNSFSAVLSEPRVSQLDSIEALKRDFSAVANDLPFVEGEVLIELLKMFIQGIDAAYEVNGGKQILDALI